MTLLIFTARISPEDYTSKDEPHNLSFHLHLKKQTTNQPTNQQQNNNNKCLLTKLFYHNSFKTVFFKKDRCV